MDDSTAVNPLRFAYVFNNITKKFQNSSFRTVEMFDTVCSEAMDSIRVFEEGRSQGRLSFWSFLQQNVFANTKIIWISLSFTNFIFSIRHISPSIIVAESTLCLLRLDKSSRLSLFPLRIFQLKFKVLSLKRMVLYHSLGFYFAVRSSQAQNQYTYRRIGWKILLLEK